MILRWIQSMLIAWHYIAPGKPQQNAFIGASMDGSGTNCSTKHCSPHSPGPAPSWGHYNTVRQHSALATYTD
jgi:putative transposase